MFVSELLASNNSALARKTALRLYRMDGSCQKLAGTLALSKAGQVKDSRWLMSELRQASESYSGPNFLVLRSLGNMHERAAVPEILKLLSPKRKRSYLTDSYACRL